MTDTTASLVRDADWLDAYSHDCMETGDMDQEAARLAGIASRIRAALSQPPVPVGWLPIETAPKKDRILVGGDGWVTETEYYDPSSWINPPTHWQPLPPAPSVKTGE